MSRILRAVPGTRSELEGRSGPEEYDPAGGESMRTLALVVSVALGLGMMGPAQTRSSASSFASSDEPLELSIGTFVFAQGEKLALEVVREEPCRCMCEEILVQAFRVLDGEGEAAFQDTATPYPVLMDAWTGRWDLRGPDGMPAAEGSYTAVVETSVGAFRAQLQIVAPGARPAGRSSAWASVCGISLSVYRLVGEEDDGDHVPLGVGEKLMVALPGNPTTGYEWEVDEEARFLARVDGVAYRASSDLVGAGGTFYFRYSAEESGEGRLAFGYRRSWEALPAEKSFAITVTVR